MCGRFTQTYAWQQVHEFLSVFGALWRTSFVGLLPGYRSRDSVSLLVLALARLNAFGGSLFPIALGMNAEVVP